MGVRLISDEGMRRHVEYYLTSLYTMHSELKEIEHRLNNLRSIAEGLRSVNGESVSGGIGRDLADVVNEINELQSHYSTSLALYSSEIAEGYVLCPIENIPRYACWLHWAEHQTWSAVARRLGYDSDYVRKKLSRKGVKEIYNEMPNRWRKDTPDKNIFKETRKNPL